MRVLLLRHGDAIGSSGKFHGMIDNPMTHKGAMEINNLADHIRKYNPKMIFTSPMSRTRASAQIISQKLGIPAQPNKALLPLDLGDFDGKPTNDKNTELVRQHLKNVDKRFPNGESTQNWADRFIPFLNQYLYNKSPDTIAMMTHGRNIILAKADRDMGNNPRYNKDMLTDNNQSTEHGGYAIITPDSFKIETPKSVASGQS